MTTLSKFTGLRNQIRPERLAPGSLTACDNVILDDTGALETRFGYLFDTALAGITDAYVVPSERYGYILASGSLYCWDGQSLRTAATGLSDTELSFAAYGDTLLYAGAHDAGRVVEGTQWYPVRMPMPPQPAVTVFESPTAPGLAAGQYQITQIYHQLGYGLDTPAPASRNIEVTTDGAALLIASDPPIGYSADIFIAKANSTVERYLGTMYGGSMGYNGQPLGRTMDDWQTNTQTLPALPVAALAVYGLCLHAAFYREASHRTQIVYSQRGSYQAYRLAKDTYAVAGHVRQMLGLDEGVLIATNQAVWLWAEDGTEAGTMTMLSQYGCPEERPISRDSAGAVLINTYRGVLTYPPVSDAAQFKFRPPACHACAVSIVHQDGMHLALVTADATGIPYTEYDS